MTTTDTSSRGWLDRPLRQVVGGATAKALGAMGLQTAEDLLEHFPRRYGEHGHLTDIGSLAVGEQATVLAEVATVNSRRMRQRKGSILDVVVTDGRAKLSLTFFNQAWRASQLSVGARGLFAGTVGSYQGKRQLTHPDYVLFGEKGYTSAREESGDASGEAEGLDRDLATVEGFTDYLIPIYPASAALPSWRIQKAVAVLLDTLPELPDPMPPEIAAREGLMPRVDAITTLHRPHDLDEVRAARKRLAYDEALVLQTVLARRRAALAASPSTPRASHGPGLLADLDARLPFTLTKGQQEVSEAITTDLAQPHPMHRLLQGEVGSGKTVVALRAMAGVVDAGGQAALLAPTEVLAHQHYRTITAMLGPLAEKGMLGGETNATRVSLLTGSQPAATRRATLLDISSGEAGMVVGTHALLQQHVEFHDLGFVVVDEQHRFGVEQREALRAKAQHPPHVLVMTATPIPRTVAMTIFGDLDISTLTELPRGRQAIDTHVVPAAERPRFVERIWERVAEEVAKGRQAYVVCPRIAEDDDDKSLESILFPEGGSGHAVLSTAEELASGPLSDCRIEVLHGQLPSDVKDTVMSRFAAGDIDVLVTTTVVEVGVDVPNASVMVVMDADRFGVSQLHQLRGRVGRGTDPGLCLLVTEQPEGTSGRARLDAVAATTDGFQLARVDLEQRREGDVLGQAQSGRRSSLKLLRAIADEELIVRARDDAESSVKTSPDLRAYPDLRDAVAHLEQEQQTEFLEKG
jgi:ATP-dependent DNA helicase RecG